jgi:Tol biopolymer transport system component
MSPLLRLLPAVFAVVLSQAHAAPITLRVQGEAQPLGTSAAPTVSADGRTIVFRSTATNLTSPAAGGTLFALDRASGLITALAPQSNGNIFYPAVSADGRYVAFETSANNLAPGEDSSFNDVLRLDRQTGSFVRASQGLGGSKANGGSDSAAISGDGRFVAFNSQASNLVAGGTTTGREHVYLMDMDSGAIELVSRSESGAEGNKDDLALEANAMSSDGTRLVFTSQSENLAPVFLGNVSDVFVRYRDPDTGDYAFEMVNRSVGGSVGTRSSSRGSISPNGRYVVFLSAATDIHPAGASPSTLFVRDLDANQLSPVPLPAGYSTCNRGRVSDSGDVLMNCSPNAPATAQQLFLARRSGGAPQLMSFNSEGQPGNGSSAQSFGMSADGRIVAMESVATNLVPLDTNAAGDVFLVGEPGALAGLFRHGFE